MAKIVVAMSGGVDSSLAAALLVEAGHNVIGVTLHLWDGDEDRLAESLCCSQEMTESARRVFEYVYSHPELTYEQVALKFQLSAQRTKQIVCEVRKRLRQALEEE